MSMSRIPMRTLLALLLALVCLAAPTLAAKAATNGNAVEASGHASDSSSSSLSSIEGTLKVGGRGVGLVAPKFVGARVLLNGGESVALVRGDGSFRFGHVVPGRSYSLDVACVEHEFPSLRVDVSAKAGQRGRVSAAQTWPTNQRVATPIVIRALGPAQYFQQREPVNVFGMLKNPMVIMMLVTVFMAVVMPKMMAGMDPQELAEMQKMQSSFSVDGLRKKLEAKASEMKEVK